MSIKCPDVYFNRFDGQLDEDNPEKGAAVIKANSTSFSPTQLLYSIVEQELLGVSYAFKDAGYFLLYARPRGSPSH